MYFDKVILFGDFVIDILEISRANNLVMSKIHFSLSKGVLDKTVKVTKAAAAAAQSPITIPGDVPQQTTVTPGDVPPQQARMTQQVRN